ncbi:MAG: hypothetical protein JRE64_13250 [Deltaproteobacteria bacterium]|nr:hypothetical protein [Deltaproteobacteria bacterium]
MIDMATVSATLSTIDVASRLIKKSIDKIKDAAVRDKIEELLNAIIPLQTHIINLQATTAELTKEKEKLETSLKNIEDWNTQAKLYQLHELAEGVFVYQYAPGSTHAGPSHYLCTNCFDVKRIKSILHRARQDGCGTYYKCNSCNSEVVDHSKPISLNDGYDGGTGGPNGWMAR